MIDQKMKIDDLDWFFCFVCKFNDFVNFEIKSIDNSGFCLTVSLKRTKFENKIFSRFLINRSDQDWIDCHMKDGIFEGFCGPVNLSELVAVFGDWIENRTGCRESKILSRLGKWYAIHCNGDWEHGSGLAIKYDPKSKCSFRVNLVETECQGKEVSLTEFEHSIKDGNLHILTPINMLPRAIDCFLNWADQFKREAVDFLNSQDHFRKRDGEKMLLENLSILIEVIKGKTINNIICFANRLHFVLADGIYFDLFSEINENDFNQIIGKKISKVKLDYPTLSFLNDDECFLKIDLDYTFLDSSVRMELHAPTEAVLAVSRWTQDIQSKDSWVLFI